MAEPFPFFQLPSELQEAILKLYYTDLALSFDLEKLSDNPYIGSATRQIRGSYLNHNIEHVCKDLRDQALKVRDRASSQVLDELVSQSTQISLSRICFEPAYDWISRNLVHLKIGLGPEMKMDWSTLLSSCSRLQHIELVDSSCWEADFRTSQFMPFDSEESKKRLIHAALAGDWYTESTCESEAAREFSNLTVMYQRLCKHNTTKSSSPGIRIILVLMVKPFNHERYYGVVYSQTTIYQPSAHFDTEKPYRWSNFERLSRKISVGEVESALTF